jgi:hypothetical protein
MSFYYTLIGQYTRELPSVFLTSIQDKPLNSVEIHDFWHQGDVPPPNIWGFGGFVLY